MHYSVGDVCQPAGENIVVIPKEVVFQYLAVKRRNAVHTKAARHAEVCHFDHAAGYNRNIVNTRALFGVVYIHILAEAAVYLLDNGINARKYRLEHRNAPLLQRLAHDCVIGIRKRLCADAPGAVPRIAVLIHQNAHKLGNRQRRMGIIDMNYDLFGKIVKRIILRKVLFYDIFQ